MLARLIFSTATAWSVLAAGIALAQAPAPSSAPPASTPYAGSASAARDTAGAPGASAPTGAGTGANTAAGGPADLGYRLGPGDKIRVIVFNEPTLSGEFLVSGTGKVSLPLVGDVQAASLTVQAFQSGVQEALGKGYLREPRVSIEVLTYRPFYILGEVMKPGEYPYSSGLNVLNAVATAGGFSYRAQTKRVFIRHLNETKEVGLALTSETPVEPGDTIRIGERFF